MVCCALIALLIGIIFWPLRKLFNSSKDNALNWQLIDSANKKGPKGFLQSRVNSLRYALTGINWVIRHEHNAWIHIVAALCVVALGIVFHISSEDWMVLVIAIMCVWFAETMNTAFEYLCDVVSPEKNESVAFAKDIAAGAVLITAFGAAIIGGIVFGPYLGLQDKEIYKMPSSICSFSF